jgi:hypothetical protein
MKVTKFINFHEVCRTLKWFDIKIKAACQTAEINRLNSQLSNQDSLTTLKTTMKREDIININMLFLHLNMTWLNKIYKIKSISSKNSLNWWDWCWMHKAYFKCNNIKHEKKQCDKLKSISTKN